MHREHNNLFNAQSCGAWVSMGLKGLIKAHASKLAKLVEQYTFDGDQVNSGQARAAAEVMIKQTSKHITQKC